MEEVSATLIVYWIRKMGSMLREKIESTKVPEKAKDVEILEVDELFSYCQKKTSRVYVWLAVDRNRNEVVDIKVSNSRDFWAYYEMAQTLEKRYRINILCTDHYEVYSKYRITHRHVKSKAETSLVESKNSLIRHYLARFNRKTKRYSKSLDMIVHSLWMLFYKNLFLSTFV